MLNLPSYSPEPINLKEDICKEPAQESFEEKVEAPNLLKNKKQEGSLLYLKSPADKSR